MGNYVVPFRQYTVQRSVELTEVTSIYMFSISRIF